MDARATSHPGMAALFALLCSLQAEPWERALELLTRIEREDTEDREAARYQLTTMEPSFAPALRKMAPFQNHPAVKSAIREAIPRLFEAWGKHLYAEGRVEDALDCFAEAAEAPDVKKYVRAKVDDAKGFIRSWLPRDVTCMNGGYVLQLRDPYEDLAKSIQGCFGPWGMAAVLELTREHPHWKYWRVLKRMGSEAVPVLCGVARSLDRYRKSFAISCLHSMARTFPRPRVTPLWLETAKAVADDMSETESVRREAKEMVEFLRW